MEVDVQSSSGFGGFVTAPAPLGIHVPRGMRVPVGDEDVEVEVDIALAEGEWRYVVQVVRGANLTSEILHALRPPEIVREAVMWALFVSRVEKMDEDEVQETAAGLAFLWAALRGEPSSLDDVDDARKVGTVALVYQLAYMVGQRPTATVMKAFGLPRSTAGRLIRQARDQGLLGPTTERKAGV